MRRMQRLDGIQVYLVHFVGGEQVLEHSGHELHVHTTGAKVVQQEGRAGILRRASVEPRTYMWSVVAPNEH